MTSYIKSLFCFFVDFKPRKSYSFVFLYVQFFFFFHFCSADIGYQLNKVQQSLLMTNFNGFFEIKTDLKLTPLEAYFLELFTNKFGVSLEMHFFV